MGSHAWVGGGVDVSRQCECDAVRAWRRALALHPAHAPTVGVYTQMLMEQDHLAAAEAVFKAALRAQPASAVVALQLAQMKHNLLLRAHVPAAGGARDLDETSEVLRLYDAALTLDPANKYALLAKAELMQVRSYLYFCTSSKASRLTAPAELARAVPRLPSSLRPHILTAYGLIYAPEALRGRARSRRRRTERRSCSTSKSFHWTPSASMPSPTPPSSFRKPPPRRKTPPPPPPPPPRPHTLRTPGPAISGSI